MGRWLWMAALAAAICAGAAPRAWAQRPWREGFETPETTWRDLGGDVRYRVERHERTNRAAHGGAVCEFLAIAAPADGSRVLIGHEIGRAAAIEEFKPSLWLLADRAGVQLMGRVVFPRALDHDGRALTAYILGEQYATVGAWQQLHLADTPKLVAEQARVLRQQWQTDVDVREAYVDRLLLNVYGGTGLTRVWIDDMDVAGYVAVNNAPAVTPQSAPHGPAAVAGGTPAVNASSGGASPGPRATIELVDSVLVVNGRPLLPRMIEYRGESLEFLRDRGFNALYLDAPATPELLAEAARLGMWLVAPPPAIAPTAGASIGPQYDVVLGWNLGNRLAEEQLEPTRRAAEAIAQADSQSSRPTFCQADAALEAYSRHVDLLLLRRLPIGTSFELSDYATWLRERPRLARPGTPFWAVVQTETALETREQWAALSGMPLAAAPATIDQLRLLTYAALATGTRGLCFQSSSRLDADDPPTRLRAASLELLNLELSWIEPWASAGHFLTAATTNLPEVAATILRTDRARLALPLWTERGAQFVPGQSAANNVTLIIPGVPETNETYEILPGNLLPLRRQRTAGGIRVTLDEFGMASMILLTQDPLALTKITQRVRETAQRAATLQRDMAAARFQAAAEANAHLDGLRLPTDQAGEWLHAARQHLQLADSGLNSGDYRSAYQEGRRALRPLQQLERAHWERAAQSLGTPTSEPLAVSFSTLPQHWMFMSQLPAITWSANQLPCGDFENLEAMQQSGWRHFQHPPAGVVAEAELAPDVKHSGSASLHLEARSVDELVVGAIVESPPVWITSPAVPVEAGQWVRIRGWVYVPTAVRGSVDGLLISDSLGGEPLSLRIGQTNNWQPVTIYRAATRAGSLSVSLALTGLGEAWVDDFIIERAAPPSAAGESVAPPPGVPGATAGSASTPFR